MHSGREVHKRICGRIDEFRDRLDDAESRIEELQEELAEMGERRCRTMRGLAEFHLPEMSEEAVAGTLRAMQGRIRGIFEAKRDRLRKVEGMIPEERAAVHRAEEALEKVTRALNETGRERARLAHLVFEELQGMARWRRLFEQARRLEARVAASERRLEAARREREGKLPPYDRDPLFSYLVRRRHGTANPAGNALTRLLDRRVAALVGYEDARASYDLLRALPGHAESALEEDRAALSAAAPPLARLEEEVIARKGMTPVLERGERLYAERDEARRSLRDAEARLRERTTELAALHDERGSWYESAIDGLEEHLAGRTLQELATMARATGDPRDDALVAELREIESRLTGLRTALAKRKGERDRVAERLAGLERLRDDFEANDWNGHRSQFNRSLDVNALLLGYLAGSHSSGHVQRALGRHQSFQPAVNEIHAALGVGGTGGFGGGGFSTGGGFGGGGGFSTGGGF